jgi:fructose-1,6-bisphosphatase/inositol monophosphatase family enzyme
MTGKPLFGTIIGLMYQGAPFMGALDQPFTRERWLGVQNKGATWNGKPIRVSSPRPLAEARLYVGSPQMFSDRIPAYLKLSSAAKWPQFACDCYAYGLMAMGHADLVVEQKLKLYDVAGLAPIVTGAGGIFVDWDGPASRLISADASWHRPLAHWPRKRSPSLRVKRPAKRDPAR